jgi:serine/threonine protein kinase
MCANVQLCSVMEWASYGSLKSFIQNAPLSVRTEHAQKIAQDMARGLEYLHSKGIAHCRVKSSNVLLKGQMEGNTFSNMEVKMGQYSPPQDEYEHVTSAGRFNAFVAPEVKQTKQFTPESDVYSFGIVLCHLFSDGAAEPLAPAQVFARPSFAGVDPKWKDLIQSCTQAEPSQRPSFSHILAVLGEMQSVADGDNNNTVRAGVASFLL